MIIRQKELLRKEVINVTSAESLGFVKDFKIDPQSGQITELIVPSNSGLFAMIPRFGEMSVPWSAIENVGKEFITVRLLESEITNLLRNSNKIVIE